MATKQNQKKRKLSDASSTQPPAKKQKVMKTKNGFCVVPTKIGNSPFYKMVFYHEQKMTKTDGTAFVEGETAMEMDESRGMEKWLTKYRDETNKESQMLQETADQILFEFDKSQKEERAKSNNEPDEDGWVTVTAKGGKKTEGVGKSIAAARGNQMALLQRKAQEKKHEKDNFYKFQRLEEKKKHIQDLRARFEQDKQRLNKMKQARKFRPS